MPYPSIPPVYTSKCLHKDKSQTLLKTNNICLGYQCRGHSIDHTPLIASNEQSFATHIIIPKRYYWDNTQGYIYLVHLFFIVYLALYGGSHLLNQLFDSLSIFVLESTTWFPWLHSKHRCVYFSLAWASAPRVSIIFVSFGQLHEYNLRMLTLILIAYLFLLLELCVFELCWRVMRVQCVSVYVYLFVLLEACIRRLGLPTRCNLKYQSSRQPLDKSHLFYSIFET